MLFRSKRYRPRAQGRGYQILKRSSQISVVLSDDKNYRKPSKAEARKAAAAALSEVATETAEAPAKKAPAKKAAAKKATAKKAPAKKAAAKNEGEAK